MLIGNLGIFIISALIIIFSGIVVSFFGDEVASRSRLGGLWIGAILIAFITSLPEVATAASAGRLGAPNLSAGDLFGSGLYNLAILAIADLIHRRQRILQAVTLGHVVSGGLAMILTALASIFIISKMELKIGWVSIGSIILLATYLLGIWLITRNRGETAVKEIEKQTKGFEEEKPGKLQEYSFLILIIVLVLAGLTILVAAPFLASSAKFLAEYSDLGTSFFGTLFIAFTTSLPELTVSIAAIRLAAFDLVVGNIFGSNAFNMGALIVLDLFYMKNSVYFALSNVHAITGLFIIMITTIAIMGLVFRSEKRYLLLEPDAGLILTLVIVALFVVWRLG